MLGNPVKSRGLVVLECLQKDKISEYLDKVQLEGIDAFTLLVFAEEIIEFRWNQKQKFTKTVGTEKAAIWCSANLYSREEMQRRSELFMDLLQQKANAITENDLFDLHLNHFQYPVSFIGPELKELKTVSISQLGLSGPRLSFAYKELKSGSHTTVIFDPIKQEL